MDCQGCVSICELLFFFEFQKHTFPKRQLEKCNFTFLFPHFFVLFFTLIFFLFSRFFLVVLQTPTTPHPHTHGRDYLIWRTQQCHCPGQWQTCSHRLFRNLYVHWSSTYHTLIIHWSFTYHSLIIHLSFTVYAAGCPPCRAIGPYVHTLSESYAGQATVVKVDVDQHQDIAQAYNITAMPTFVFIKDSKEAKRIRGADKAGIDSTFKSLL